MPITSVGVDSGEPSSGGSRVGALPVAGFLLAGAILVIAAVRIVCRHHEAHRARYAAHHRHAKK